MIRNFWVIIGAALWLISSIPALAADYDHAVRLSNMRFEWRVQGETLHVRLSGKTGGWVSIGFNPENRMQGADIIIGYVKNGEVVIRDHYGIRPLQHIDDERNGGGNDVTILGGSEAGGTTTLRFSMPLDSGDVNDTRIDPQGWTGVILAYGPDRDTFTSRHQYRTTLQVNLGQGSYR